MRIDTTYRAHGQEIMDDFSLEGEELRDALDKIANINQLLGGNRLTFKGIKKLLRSCHDTITILDIGCGNGDMLRMLSRFGKRHGYNLVLIGVDANCFTIKYAMDLSQEYDNISYKCLDIFSEEFALLEYDIALCTLTLHHFNDTDIIKLIREVHNKASTGIVINDLHRNKVAYRLFEMICVLFGLNRMSREDGLLSILKGFKKCDFCAFSKKLGLRNYSIRWQWAFRYQWIIYKI